MSRIINRSRTLLILMLCILSISASNAEDSPSDFGFSALVGWAWRDINGTMFSYSPPLNGAATADSLGLGSSSQPDAANHLFDGHVITDVEVWFSRIDLSK